MRQLWGILTLFCANSFSQPEGFTKILPEHSGVYFSNSITETPEINITMYDYLYNGGGVGIGDFNKDGLQDIFLTGNFVDDKLYFNRGDFKFEDVTEKSGITKNGWSTGVCVFDINEDGYDDIYVCRSGWFEDPNQLRNVLYINQKNGKFKEESASYGLDLTGHHTQAAPLDFDLDGDLDLYVMGHPGTFKHKSDFASYVNNILEGKIESDILLENVDGKYIDITKKAGIFEFGYGLGIAITDINLDHFPDIIICNDFDEPDHIFVNQKDGTFKDENLNYFKHTSNYSMGNDVADFNNDGLLDYISVDMAFETHERSKMNMASMSPAKFWARVKLGWGYQYMHNMLHLNTGKGVYQEIAQFSGVAKTDWSWAPLFMDIDMDGWQDLFISNGYKRDTKNNDIQNMINAQLEKQERLDVMKLLDLIPSVEIENFFFKNTRDLKFSDKRADWGVDEKLNSNGAAYADLDNDGDLDLVLNNVDATASVYKNITSNGNNYLKVDLSELSDAEKSGLRVQLSTGSGSQIREAHFIRGYQSSVEQNLFFYWEEQDQANWIRFIFPTRDGIYNNQYLIRNPAANTTLKFQKKSEYKQENWQQPAPFEYFTDITDSLLPTIYYLENDYDDFMSESLLPHRISDSGPDLLVEDFNNDGLQDFVITSSVGKIPQVFLQQENGKFSQLLSPAFYNHQGSEDGGIFALKANNDNYLDLVISSGGYQYANGDSNYINRLYIGNGQGGFGYVKNALPKDAFNSGKIIGTDLDADSDTDLLICGKAAPGRYPYPGTTSLLLNNKGFFVDITENVAPGLKHIGMVNDACFADLDGDKDEDLVVVGEWMDIEIFIRDKGQLVRQQNKLNMPGWWSCVTANDIDLDGDIDLLLGNAGLNNKFKASPEKPLDIYANDFDDNGSLDIVLAFNKDHHQLPVRGRECSSGQMPFLLEKFPTYLSFASSDLEQIYSREKLDSSLHYQATEFRSGVLYNQGEGEFSFTAFANEAQLSFINDFVVVDIVGDGQHDIIAVGNRFGTEVETTRYDAGCGLVMMNDSHGKNRFLGYQFSNFVVPDDVKSVRLIYLGKEKKTGILTASNNGMVRLFIANDIGF